MEVRRMTQQDLAAVVDVTVQCFAPSDFYHYIAPEEDRRLTFLNVMFGGRTRSALAQYDVDLAVENGEILAAATWIPPQTASPRQNVQAASDPAFAILPEDIQNRWQSFLQTLTTARAESLRQPFWSLSPIVVAPKAQGKGLASLLIRKKLWEIHTAPLPCFLATQDAKNRDIYTRYGFAVTRADRLDGSEIISYTMVRPS